MLRICIPIPASNLGNRRLTGYPRRKTAHRAPPIRKNAPLGPFFPETIPPLKAGSTPGDTRNAKPSPQASQKSEKILVTRRPILGQKSALFSGTLPIIRAKPCTRRISGLLPTGLSGTRQNTTYPPDIARLSSSLWARSMFPPCGKLASCSEPRSPLERGFFLLCAWLHPLRRNLRRMKISSQFQHSPALSA